MPVGELLLADADARTGSQASPPQPGALRSRAVQLDRDALRTAVEARKRQTGMSRLRIRLFDDVVIDFDPAHAERTRSGGFALAGRHGEDPADSVVVVDNDGVVALGAQIRGRRYTLRGSPQAGYQAAEWPAAPPLPEAAGNDALPLPVQPSPAPGGARSPARWKAASLLDDGSLIDLMVAYTPAARVANGGSAQMQANIDAQIAFTNLIYQNSGVVQRLRLVHVAEIPFVEDNPFNDLFAVNAPFDGRADEVQVLRDVYRADLVSFWGAWPALGGIAYLGTPEGLSVLPWYAVSILSSPLATNPTDTTLAHELGHNMGLRHDLVTEPGSTTQVTPEGSTTLTAIGYAHGHVDPVNRFRTVMSYPICETQHGYACRLLPLFSNPTLTHDNRSYYPAAVPAPLGDALLADERRALNDTRDSLANYRASLASQGGPGIIALDMPRRRVAEGAGSLTIRVSRHAGAGGAVSVDYATVSGSAVAGEDYAATSGTLSWADGDSSAQAVVIPVLQDSVLEGDEMLTLALSNPTGGAELGGHQGAGASSELTIVDDEPDVFPQGESLPPGFGTPAGSPAWTVDLGRGYRSTASLRSAVTYAVQTSPGVFQEAYSETEFSGQVGTGWMSFAYRTSSGAESRLEFYIDNVRVFTQPGGETGWAVSRHFLTAGNRTLRWRFVNLRPAPCQPRPIPVDGGLPCEDRAFIDEVVLPADGQPLVANHAFVPNEGGSNVSVIDLSSNTVVDTIPVGFNPTGVATHPDGSRVYIGNQGSASVSVIDTYTRSVVATIGVGPNPYGLAVAPDGGRLYVANAGASHLTVIDTASNTRLPDIPSWPSAVGLAINPAGTRAYTGINNGSAAQVFDLIGGTLIATTTLSNRSFGVAVSSTGDRAYVVQNQAGRVAIIDTTSNAYVNHINVPGQPIGVAVSPATDAVYTTTGTANSLAHYDRKTGVVTAWPVGTAPYGVAVDPTGARILVANSGSNTVSVLDATLHAPLATIPVGPLPRGLGNFIAPHTVPGPPRALVAGPGNGRVSLRFDAPLYHGGRLVTGYTATCMPGNVEASSSASPLVVSGLTNGVNYSCSVRARNAVGLGRVSDAVSVTPAAATFIFSPDSARFTVLSPGSFTVQTTGLPPTAISVSGALPGGVTMTPAGVLAGTPVSGSAGSYPLTITASNGVTPDATQAFTLTVDRIAQSINFAALPARSLTDGSFGVSATGGASGNPVTFSSLTPAVCTTTGTHGSTVQLLAGGYCDIAADQAAGLDHAAAPQVVRGFTVRWPQTISFGSVPPMVYGMQVQLAPIGGGSGNVVRISSATPATCTTTGITGRTLTAVAAGSCTLNATQAGSSTHDPGQATLTLEIARAPQVLGFSSQPLPIGQAVRRDTSIGASTMPVVLQVSTPAVCTTSGLEITAIGPGYCRFRANQAGDANYLPATEVPVELKSATLLGAARSHHSATRLLDGRVLVAGGQTTGGVIHASAEIYDPATMRWSATGGLARERMEHTAVRLPDGRVLVAGGYGNNFVLNGTAEIYDPATGSWSAAGQLVTPRQYHTASLLDGSPARVLLVGGAGQDGVVLASAEIFDAATLTWSATGNLAQRRFAHTAARLPDGRVLISGGASASNVVFGSSEIYNPASGSFTAAAATAARAWHTASVLADGSVLLANGSNPAAVRYQPASNSWSAAGNVGIALSQSTATVLANGRVLLAGGADAAGPRDANLLYDPAGNAWTASSALLFPRRAHTATLLQDGSVLVVGGITPGGNFPRTATAELYRPEFTLLAATLPRVPVNAAYPAQSLSTQGGLAPIGYAISGGALPPGMTLSPQGVLDGTPTQGGAFAFTVTASDASGQSAVREFALEVAYTVSASGGSGGGIDPVGAVLVTGNATASFTLTPEPSYAPVVSGSCGGTLSGNSYTTQSVTADCTVVASFVSTAVVPGAPVIGTAVAGTAQASVSFTPPADDGGASIQGYTATATPGGASASCSAPCSSITVSGLDNGVAHTLTVRASNRAGDGPESAPSNPVTPLLAQVISFGPAPLVEVGFGSTVVVSGGGSGNPVVLASQTPAVCTVAGNTVTGVIPGSCRIAADQAGSATHFPAPQALLTLNVSYRVHRVTPSAGTNGSIAPATPFSVVHGSVRTLTLSPLTGYTALVGGSCGGSLAGNLYTTLPVTADCSVDAVFARPPGAPLIGAAVAGDTQATVAFAAPADDGGSAILGYTATSTPPGGSASCSAPCSELTVAGLSNGTAYTFTVVATNAVGPGAPSAASASVTPVAPQQIVLGPAPRVVVGGSGTLQASGGGSGNPVVFSSATPATCSVAGTHGATVNGLQPGTCTIAANQAGSAAYSPAPEVQQSFPVIATYVVTPSAGANGTISPATPQTLASGDSTSFTLTPAPGYTAAVAGSCGGTLAGAVYTTAPVTQDCSVVASFVTVPGVPRNPVVTPLAGAARLAFDPPQQDGGSPVLDYLAECTPGSASAVGNDSPVVVSGLANQVVHRCRVRARNAQGLGEPTPELAVIPGSTGTTADLSISKSNGVGYVNGGAPVDYLITVGNAGPAGVIGARAQDPLAPDLASATWTCTPLGNAVCGAASGSGSLDLAVDLPANASVQILLSALPAPGPDLPLSNTATVTPPAGISDGNPANNSATDGPDVRGLFRNGFE